MKSADSLLPDVAVDIGRSAIAGRPLAVRVTANAVTAADLWLYDEKTGIAVLGDLVTLPAPFFETACPARWQEPLDEVWATPFRARGARTRRADDRGSSSTSIAAPSRPSVAASPATPPPTCAAGWTKDYRGVPRRPTAIDGRRREYAAYYVDFLRKNGGASPDCAQK